jgi:hypothetical protein
MQVKLETSKYRNGKDTFRCMASCEGVTEFGYGETIEEAEQEALGKVRRERDILGEKTIKFVDLKTGLEVGDE